MEKLIAGLYEIDKEIGAGGAGIVYIGTHLRLNKKVVLKADKRNTDIPIETLRREVDLLKELRHTNIPQVYDFVEHEGRVYTVMDFIEGESLDKLLKRGEKRPQREVIRWACQLLDALNYLHTRPPYGILHGDIKPANIMLRPDGNICLIDYNIALMLGADGAVQVGYSRGYASPEHYGSDYVESMRLTHDTTTNSRQRSRSAYTGHIFKSRIFSDIEDTDKTEAIDNRTVYLDARSDIYSLGATLYHILSGRKPKEDAWEVDGLGKDDCSNAVAAIIKKSMQPESSDRYQTAEEMLQAFTNIWHDDKRSVSLRRSRNTAIGIITVVLTIGAGAIFTGAMERLQRQRALTHAEYSGEALRQGNITQAVKEAMEALPREHNIMDAPVTPEAQLALTNALGVYNLDDGFVDKDVIELPDIPFKMTLSPGGKLLAVVYPYECAVYDMVSLRCINRMPVEESAFSDVIFVDDSRVIYAAEGGVSMYDMEIGDTVWTGASATKLTLSGDGQIVAAVNRDEDKVILYSVQTGQEVTKIDLEGSHLPIPENDRFADPDNYVFSLNKDGSCLAISLHNRGLELIETGGSHQNRVISDAAGASESNGGFAGDFFAYSIYNNGRAEFSIIDTRTYENVSGMESDLPYHVKTAGDNIYVANGAILERLDTEMFSEEEVAYVPGKVISQFAVSGEEAFIVSDKGLDFFENTASVKYEGESDRKPDFALLAGDYAAIADRNTPAIRLIERLSHADKDKLTYDIGFIHDESRISGDEKTYMLYNYQAFEIYDANGNKLLRQELENPEQVYDQQFRREEEGSYLEVIWYDGMIRRYSAKDGSLLSEEMREKPDENLKETFDLGDYRIETALHNVPEVINNKDKAVKKLEDEGYLTYASEFEGYYLTEYVSSEGLRYGYLLNKDFEKTAYLPNLCDAWNKNVYFDSNKGVIRADRLYELDELKNMAEDYLSKNEN